MFGRATIRLGIGPHSSFCCFSCRTYQCSVLKLRRRKCGVGMASGHKGFGIIGGWVML